MFFNELTAFKNTLILSRVLNSTLAQPAFSQLDAHIHPSSHYLLNILFTCSIFSLMAVAENFVTLYRMFYLNRSSQKIPSKLFLIPENTSSRRWIQEDRDRRCYPLYITFYPIIVPFLTLENIFSLSEIWKIWNMKLDTRDVSFQFYAKHFQILQIPFGCWDESRIMVTYYHATRTVNSCSSVLKPFI